MGLLLPSSALGSSTPRSPKQPPKAALFANGNRRTGLSCAAVQAPLQVRRRFLAGGVGVLGLWQPHTGVVLEVASLVRWDRVGALHNFFYALTLRGLWSCVVRAQHTLRQRRCCASYPNGVSVGARFTCRFAHRAAKCIMFPLPSAVYTQMQKKKRIQQYYERCAPSRKLKSRPQSPVSSASPHRLEMWPCTYIVFFDEALYTKR